jgi:hypothetical protein
VSIALIEMGAFFLATLLLLVLLKAVVAINLTEFMPVLPSVVHSERDVFYFGLD